MSEIEILEAWAIAHDEDAGVLYYSQVEGVFIAQTSSANGERVARGASFLAAVEKYEEIWGEER